MVGWHSSFHTGPLFASSTVLTVELEPHTSPCSPPRKLWTSGCQFTLLGCGSVLSRELSLASKKGSVQYNDHPSAVSVTDCPLQYRQDVEPESDARLHKPDAADGPRPRRRRRLPRRWPKSPRLHRTRRRPGPPRRWCHGLQQCPVQRRRWSSCHQVPKNQRCEQRDLQRRYVWP